MADLAYQADQSQRNGHSAMTTPPATPPPDVSPPNGTSAAVPEEVAAPTGEARLNPRFVIRREGKPFALYAGLLDLAHQEGLSSITTTLVQIPSELNLMTAVVYCTVQTDRGVFSGLGDANPQNVSRLMVPHLIRMAETRSKARALRDAVNVGVTAFEELGEDEARLGGGEAFEATGRAEPGWPGAGAGSAAPRRIRPAATPAAPAALDPAAPATAGQVAAIEKLARLVGAAPATGGLTHEQAGRLIVALQDQLQRKGSAAQGERA
jgi:hypothetical protein